MNLLLNNMSMRSIFAGAFSFIFFVLSGVIAVAMLVMFIEKFFMGDDFMEIILKTVNTGIIALAVFELAMVINQEYRIDKEEHNVINGIRRSLPRFIGTVCVALALEGLIMVIKYSQLDMVDKLYYPVAVIMSTAFLLAALGIFLKLSPEPKARNEGINEPKNSSIIKLPEERVGQPMAAYNSD